MLFSRDEYGRKRYKKFVQAGKLVALCSYSNVLYNTDNNAT